MLEDLPAGIGGEPDTLPAPPALPYDYPAVHDMPPQRATKPMSDAEKVRMEKDLEAARDRQEREYGSPKKTTPKPDPAAKKRPSGADGGPTAGTGGSPGNGTGAKPNP